MATSQKQKSIRSLHTAAREKFHISPILETSTKSESALGVALSAFNLSFTTIRHGRTLTVESAFQASKIFELGGPYLDLLDKAPAEAKNDLRIRNSGRLIEFRFFGERWPLVPRTAFYDWLFLNALKKQPQITEQLDEYSGFTDIEFNPEKSINCQAYSVALYVSLNRRSLLDDALRSREDFLRIVGSARQSNARVDELTQPRLNLAE